MRARKIVNLSNQYRFSFEAPIYQASIPAGINKEQSLFDSVDLNIMLAPKPDNTFLVRVTGDSMIDKNIHEGDILVVDSSIEPTNNKIVIASLNSELTVKTYKVKDGQVLLVSANKKFNPIKITDFMEFKIQGVVKHVIKFV